MFSERKVKWTGWCVIHQSKMHFREHTQTYQSNTMDKAFFYLSIIAVQNNYDC
jgi:hypothetical protein